MKAVNRNPIVYGLLTVSVLLMGLASRQFFGDVLFVKLYVGDALWAMMVFFALALTFRQWPVKTVTLAALLFSFGIEISQLYHAPWMDSLRATRLGGLILGFSFVWSDLICYSVGIALSAFAETYLIPTRYVKGPKTKSPVNRTG